MDEAWWIHVALDLVFTIVSFAPLQGGLEGVSYKRHKRGLRRIEVALKS